MKTIIPVVFSLALTFLARPARAEANTPDELKKCADLQAQKDAAAKSHNPLFSQIRAKHLEAEMKALRCPEPAPGAPASSVTATDKGPGTKDLSR